MNEYTVGNNVKIPMRLLLDGSPENLSGYSSIKAAITNSQRTALATGCPVVTCTIVSAIDGTVEAQWLSAETDEIEPNIYLVEVQAIAGTEKITFERVAIRFVAGLIP